MSDLKAEIAAKEAWVDDEVEKLHQAGEPIELVWFDRTGEDKRTLRIMLQNRLIAERRF